MTTRRHLQIEDEIECYGWPLAIFEESDVPQFYKSGSEPPPKAPVTWAWAFMGSNLRDKPDIETIFLGFPTKQAALDDAFAYRRECLADCS